MQGNVYSTDAQYTQCNKYIACTPGVLSWCALCAGHSMLSPKARCPPRHATLSMLHRPAYCAHSWYRVLFLLPSVDHSWSRVAWGEVARPTLGGNSATCGSARNVQYTAAR